MVALFSRVVIHGTCPYGEVPRKQPESPCDTQFSKKREVEVYLFCTFFLPGLLLLGFGILVGKH
jgi:hypothetical protein